MDKEIAQEKQVPSKIRQNKKLVQQIIILVIIVIAIMFLLFFKPGSSKPKTTTTAPKLNTSFDQSALDQLKNKDTSYPNVTPNPSELGKSDPFAR